MWCGLLPELSKNKTGRMLPLHGDLFDVLERAAERRRLDCLYVFHVEGQHTASRLAKWKHWLSWAGSLIGGPALEVRCSLSGTFAPLHGRKTDPTDGSGLHGW